MTHDKSQMANPHSVAIIGSGLVGRSWAIAFARGGQSVRLFDRESGVAESARNQIEPVLRSLAGDGLLNDQSPADVLDRIAVADDLAAALSDADYVQENTPEDVDVKRSVFAELDAAAPPDAVIASSTSAILPSRFTGGLSGASRCLVVHPLNPPHLCAAVEVVPGVETSPDAVRTAADLLRTIGSKPIVVDREIEGFVLNRLQGAVLDEAFKLVAEGYASVDDVDAAIKDGLALRWSFMGPFETIDLNAPGGVADFLQRYKTAYETIGTERPHRHEWSGDLAETITAARRRHLPVEQLADRQTWRDQRLAALVAHKNQQPE